MMHGFKEDLLNVVARYIEENWERVGCNVDYFVDRVSKSGLTTADLADYLIERKQVAPVCVITVFDAIVNPLEEGGNA